MQMCRQEIVEHVRELRNSVTRMVAMSSNGVNHKDANENDLFGHRDIMDEDSSHDADDDEFLR